MLKLSYKSTDLKDNGILSSINIACKIKEKGVPQVEMKISERPLGRKKHQEQKLESIKKMIIFR